VIILTIGGEKKRSLGKETSGEDAPGASDHVDGDGIDSVINAESNQRLGAEQVEPSGHETDEDSGPSLDRLCTFGEHK
jgi:hypothetical protein